PTSACCAASSLRIVSSILSSLRPSSSRSFLFSARAITIADIVSSNGDRGLRCYGTRPGESRGIFGTGRYILGLRPSILIHCGVEVVEQGAWSVVACDPRGHRVCDRTGGVDYALPRIVDSLV